MKIYQNHFIKVLSKFKKSMLYCLLYIFLLLRKLKNHIYVFFIVYLPCCDDKQNVTQIPSVKSFGK